MINEEDLLKELTFKFVRSSGSGGQHVNKVATKAILSFNLLASKALSENQKHLLFFKLKHKLNKDNCLILQSSKTRSQLKNKDLVTAKFMSLIKNGLTVKKRRIATKISKAAIQKRLKNKKRLSEKKTNRKKPNIIN